MYISCAVIIIMRGVIIRLHIGDPVDHVVAALAPEVATEVRDIILHPPASDPYDELRKQLIQRTSQSERRRLQQLLNNHDFGDLTPTRLLRKLQQLRGQDTDDPLFRELFLQRLPTSIRVVLASFDDTLSLDELAIRAERMTEADSVVSRSAVSEVTSSPETSECEVNRLRADIVDLRKRLTKPASKVQVPSRGEDSAPHLCWYHFRFGEAARKCKPPCSQAGNFRAGR